MTALNSMSVGQSLHLECNVTASNIIDSVDFVWKANDTELDTTTVNNASVSTANEATFTHLYNTTPLTEADNNTKYMCTVAITGMPSVSKSGVFQLTLPPSSHSKYLYYQIAT